METEQVTDWIRDYVARLLGVDSDSIDPEVPFERYGLDSTAAVGLSGDLGDLLKVKLETNVVFQYPTIKSLAEHVSLVLEKKTLGRAGMAR
jgi:acyl carrier protein